MLKDAINRLTPAQKSELAAKRIPQQRLSEFARGVRLPTEEQVAIIASVTGADWVELAAEVAVARARPENRAEVARVVGKKLHSAAVVGALLLVAMLRGFGASADAPNVAGLEPCPAP